MCLRLQGEGLAELWGHQMKPGVRRPGFELQLGFLPWLARLVDPTEPSFSFVKRGKNI